MHYINIKMAKLIKISFEIYTIIDLTVDNTLYF